MLASAPSLLRGLAVWQAKHLSFYPPRMSQASDLRQHHCSGVVRALEQAVDDADTLAQLVDLLHPGPLDHGVVVHDRGRDQHVTVSGLVPLVLAPLHGHLGLLSGREAFVEGQLVLELGHEEHERLERIELALELRLGRGVRVGDGRLELHELKRHLPALLHARGELEGRGFVADPVQRVLGSTGQLSVPTLELLHATQGLSDSTNVRGLGHGRCLLFWCK